MLYSLLTSFINEFSFLNVFRYLTFRTGLSLISSFIIVFLIGGPFIKYFSQKKITGPIREDGPIDHIFKKVGTPTMGGVLILCAVLLPTFLFAKLDNVYIQIIFLSTIWMGLIGFLDDYLKIIKKIEKALTNRFTKLMNFASWSADKKIHEKLQTGLVNSQGIDSDNDIISLDENYL